MDGDSGAARLRVVRDGPTSLPVQVDRRVSGDAELSEIEGRVWACARACAYAGRAGEGESQEERGSGGKLQEDGGSGGKREGGLLPQVCTSTAKMAARSYKITWTQRRAMEPSDKCTHVGLLACCHQ